MMLMIKHNKRYPRAFLKRSSLIYSLSNKRKGLLNVCRTNNTWKTNRKLVLIHQRYRLKIENLLIHVMRYDEAEIYCSLEAENIYYKRRKQSKRERENTWSFQWFSQRECFEHDELALIKHIVILLYVLCVLYTLLFHCMAHCAIRSRFSTGSWIA